MNGANFGDNIQKLLKWFRTTLDNDHKNIIFERIKFIPDQAFSEICDRLIETRKPQPSNFPTIQEFKEAWSMWRKEHPQSIMSIAATLRHCSDCNDWGMITYRFQSDKYACGWDERTVICADCDNWKRHFNRVDEWVKESRNDIEAKSGDIGQFEIWPYKSKLSPVQRNMAINDFKEKVAIDFSESRYQPRIEELKKQAEIILEDEIPF